MAPDLAIWVGYSTGFKGVNPKSHHTKMPTAMPRRNGNTGDQLPPGHSNIGLPNHDVQRSQLDTPPGMLHPAVIVPRRVTTPADVDRTIRDAIFNTRIPGRYPQLRTYQHQYLRVGVSLLG